MTTSSYTVIKSFSDNRSCRKGFRPCYNQRCVASSRFCDGIDDCGDNSDEAFCSSELQPFDVVSYPFCLKEPIQDLLMLMLIQHTWPHSVLSSYCLMSPKIIRTAQIKRDAQLLSLTAFLPAARIIFAIVFFFFIFARGIFFSLIQFWPLQILSFLCYN